MGDGVLHRMTVTAFIDLPDEIVVTNVSSWLTVGFTSPAEMVHEMKNRFSHRYLGTTRDAQGVIIDNRELHYVQTVELNTDI